MSIGLNRMGLLGLALASASRHHTSSDRPVHAHTDPNIDDSLGRIYSKHHQPKLRADTRATNRKKNKAAKKARKGNRK